MEASVSQPYGSPRLVTEIAPLMFESRLIPIQYLTVRAHFICLLKSQNAMLVGDINV
jgi:hypothetical protein